MITFINSYIHQITNDTYTYLLEKSVCALHRSPRPCNVVCDHQHPQMRMTVHLCLMMRSLCQPCEGKLGRAIGNGCGGSAGEKTQC